MDIKDVFSFLDDYPVFRDLLIFLLVIVSGLLLNFIAKKLLLRYLNFLFSKTKNKWGKILLDNKVFDGFPLILIALLVFQSLETLPAIAEVGQRLVSTWIAVIVILILDRFLSAVLVIYNTYSISKKRPLKGYVQTAKLILYIVGGIIGVSLLMDESPWVFVSGLAALTAVLLVVFKDTILSFVASVQLMGNDLVRLGDWVEMSKYGADGDVIEIALHTVKIKNFDNTITTIPTYKLMEDSFKNWRNMQESGARRVKRSIIIDQASIKFCDEEMLNKFERIQLIKDYIAKRKTMIDEYNREHDIDTSLLVNGRHMTNVGTFRAYLTAYLRQHPKIRTDLIVMVRQLDPEEKGLPLEIYAFTNDVAWANHEEIQSDIFDHIMAVVPEFELRIAQKPTGYDIKQVVFNKDIYHDDSGD